MKKIFIGFLTLGLLLGTASCKDAEKHEHEHSHDGGEMHSHEHDDDHHGDEATHTHDGEEHSHDNATEDHDHDDKMMNKSIVVAMGSKSGSNVSGTITLTQAGEVVNMVADLNGLTEGEHAIHIHQKGDCSSDDGKSAGGHWNPTEENHGKWGQEMHHSGDIGNLIADAEGNATLTFSTDKWCIGCDDENKNVIGKGFIVHASADDFESQPSGAAGARVACGVIAE